MVWKGIIIVATNTKNISLLSLLLLRTSIHAVIEANKTIIAIETTVTIIEFPKALKKFIFSIASL